MSHRTIQLWGMLQLCIQDIISMALLILPPQRMLDYLCFWGGVRFFLISVSLVSYLSWQITLYCFSPVCFLFKKKKKVVGKLSWALNKFCYFPCNILVLHHTYKFFVAQCWKLHPAQICSLFLQSPQTCVSVRMNLACVGLFSSFVASDQTQITHFFLKDAPAILHHTAVPAVGKLSLHKISWVIYFPSLHLSLFPSENTSFPLNASC